MVGVPNLSVPTTPVPLLPFLNIWVRKVVIIFLFTSTIHTTEALLLFGGNSLKGNPGVGVLDLRSIRVNSVSANVVFGLVVFCYLYRGPRLRG